MSVSNATVHEISGPSVEFFVHVTSAHQFRPF